MGKKEEQQEKRGLLRFNTERKQSYPMTHIINKHTHAHTTHRHVRKYNNKYGLWLLRQFLGSRIITRLREARRYTTTLQ